MKARKSVERRVISQSKGANSKGTKSTENKSNREASKYKKTQRPEAKVSLVLKESPVMRSIVEALSHPEAEDGLYFRNFAILHEEDCRARVAASSPEIASALTELIKEGRVKIDFDDIETVFRLTV